MKPFLGIDITQDKNNEQFNGEEFLVAKTSQAQSQALEQASMNSVELLNKATTPMWYTILMIVCVMLGSSGILGMVSFASEEDDIGFLDVYAKLPWLFWLSLAFIAVFAVMSIFAKRKVNDVLESNESEHVSSQLDTIAKNIYAELGVPANAPEVDILSFSYKLKNGEPVVKETDFSITPYDNLVNRVFVEDNILFIADREGKYAFSLSELRAIRTVKKTIIVPMWYKDTPHNKGEYKAYKINLDDDANVSFKPYHILELEHNGEIWGIYFPCYELPIFEKLTGLKAE